MQKLRVKRISPSASLPRYAHVGDAGLDLCSAEGCTLEPGQRRLVKTGFAFELPPNTEGQLRPCSGLALHHGITILNAPGTIDSGYRGEIGVILVNFGETRFVIEPGMRIAQLVIATVERVLVEEVLQLPESERGTSGFGSTGR